MEPILIPSVPREAFNKHRRISDLVRKQVEHFRHIEKRLPADIRATLPQHEIVTEDDAARYIGPITDYLLSRPQPKSQSKKVVSIKSAVPMRRSLPVTLTAAASPALKKSPAKKKSAPKKETTKAHKSPSIRSKTKKSAPKRKK